MQAWDENADPFTRTVYVTIARLKRKLGEPAPIQTNPGLGYKIAASDGMTGDMPALLPPGGNHRAGTIAVV